MTARHLLYVVSFAAVVVAVPSLTAKAVAIIGIILCLFL